MVHGIIRQFDLNLSGHKFEDDLKTGHNDRYELMCAANASSRINPPGPDDESSGGGIPLITTSYTDALVSLSHKINFSDNCLQCYKENYGEITGLYQNNMEELFKNFPLSLPTRKNDDYKQKYNMTIDAVGGDQFPDNNNAKLPPI